MTRKVVRIDPYEAIESTAERFAESLTIIAGIERKEREMTEPRIISVEQADHIIAQGPCLWGPDENNVAAIEIDGEEIVGTYVPSLFDDKDESILPFE